MATSNPVTSRPDAAVRLVGLLVIIVGALMVVAGVTTYVVVQQTLAAENISVSDDADWFAGNDVAGPLSAYSEAATIAKHAEGIADGKTYAEIAQDDPRRESVMTASFLRASLFTSVVAFGVAALVVALGAVLVALGWALRRLGSAPA
ncbi:MULTISPECIES: aromatic ring-opening dioxygenase LigA [unclassified Nocardioides]|uniref:aromatic ring-opening dioxygenase LigA n=1 Tax=unclassified Nocardioides TaxID=2615069 RepID=UPI003015704B